MILSTLMMVTIRSSKTYVLERAARRRILEDGTFYIHSCENLKYYIAICSLIISALRKVGLDEKVILKWFVKYLLHV
jgi:hypothetical protein